MSLKADTLPTAPGWYLPTAPAEPGFWNPYLLETDGSWWEVDTRDGMTSVEAHSIVRPIGRLMFDPNWADPFTAATAATH